jgi:hypothetical protein
MVSLTIGRILGYAAANFIWQAVTGKHDWEFAATVSFFQAWAIGFAVRDTYKRLTTSGKVRP